MQQQLVTKLEKDIAVFEGQIAEISAELEKQETYQQAGRAQQLNRELTAAQTSLGKVSAEWEASSSKLLALEATAVPVST